MNNIIKDNRVVKDETFAVRFLSFVESVGVSCAAGEDERNAMLSYAKALLKHQVRTATCRGEIHYLKNLGVWDKYQEPILETDDGFTIHYESEDCSLFSCLKEPKNGDPVLYLSTEKLRNSRVGLKENRMYFKYEKNCLKYIDNNKPRYSKNDLELMLKDYNIL